MRGCNCIFLFILVFLQSLFYSILGGIYYQLPFLLVFPLFTHSLFNSFYLTFWGGIIAFFFLYWYFYNVFFIRCLGVYITICPSCWILLFLFCILRGYNCFFLFWQSLFYSILGGILPFALLVGFTSFYHSLHFTQS